MNDFMTKKDVRRINTQKRDATNDYHSILYTYEGKEYEGFDVDKDKAEEKALANYKKGCRPIAVNNVELQLNIKDISTEKRPGTNDYLTTIITHTGETYVGVNADKSKSKAKAMQHYYTYEKDMKGVNDKKGKPALQPQTDDDIKINHTEKFEALGLYVTTIRTHDGVGYIGADEDESVSKNKAMAHYLAYKKEVQDFNDRVETLKDNKVNPTHKVQPANNVKNIITQKRDATNDYISILETYSGNKYEGIHVDSIGSKEIAFLKYKDAQSQEGSEESKVLWTVDSKAQSVFLGDDALAMMGIDLTDDNPFVVDDFGNTYMRKSNYSISTKDNPMIAGVQPPDIQQELAHHVNQLTVHLEGLIEKAKRAGVQDKRLLEMAATDFERGFMAFNKALAGDIIKPN